MRSTALHHLFSMIAAACLGIIGLFVGTNAVQTDFQWVLLILLTIWVTTTAVALVFLGYKGHNSNQKKLQAIEKMLWDLRQLAP